MDKQYFWLVSIKFSSDMALNIYESQSLIVAKTLQIMGHPNAHMMHKSLIFLHMHVYMPCAPFSMHNFFGSPLVPFEIETKFLIS